MTDTSEVTVADSAADSQANASDSPNQLAWVDNYTGLLDTKFVIPGTEVRFGVDFLLGLVPGVGDVLSLGFSGVLVATMAKHGASPLLVLKMLINVGLDATIGSIPVLGNVFDLFYKANTRNLDLMKEHYQEGMHSGSIWPALITIAIVLMLVMAVMIWILFRIASWLAVQFET